MSESLAELPLEVVTLGVDGIASDQLFRTLVRNANDLVTVFDDRGIIVFINDAATAILGGTAEQYVGTSIFTFVHPDEHDRALMTLSVAREYGPARGSTHFRVRAVTGAYVPLEMTAGRATHGDRTFITTFGRPADTRAGLERALLQLVSQAPISDVMTTVCDTVSWRELESRVAIVWTMPDGREHVVTQGGALHPALCGVAPENAEHIDDPFVRTRRTGVRQRAADLSELPAPLRAIAEAHGRGGYWVEPVSVADRTAMIVVWTVANGFPPTVHVQGMELARSIVEVILQWTDQQWRLDYAANHDELTGLPNRKPFFRALEAAVSGAVLYGDLDEFKPVNDRFGHAAGDQVLQQVAQRMTQCVREGDTVARIGGDEFAILCPWSSADDAELLAERIRGAMVAPFHVAGATIHVGISVGVSHTTHRMDEATVAEADRMLREAKTMRQAGR